MKILPPVILLATLPAAGFAPSSDLQAGRYLKVLREAEARLAQEPANALAHAARSQALSSLLRFQDALAAAQRAIDLDPALGQAWLARGLARAGGAVQQRNFGSLRQASGALQDLRRATELDPSLQHAWTSLGLAYQQLPGILGGSTRRALACATALERLAPARGWALRATVLALDGRFEEASGWFEKAVSQAPKDEQVVSAYLDALSGRSAKKALGEPAQKARLAAEARRLAPGLRGRARGIEAASLALLEAGSPEEAWGLAIADLSDADAPSLLRLHLGKLAARSGLHREEGLAALDRVLQEPLEGGSGGYPATHWRRGQILRDLGRRDEARRAALAALALDPKHPGAGKLLEDLGS